MGLLVLYAFLSIAISFLCSILEAVILSVTPTFINIKKSEGKAFAVTLENLKNDVDKPLIAILTLNTIAHTVGAILVGVQAKTAYAETYGENVRTIFGFEYTEEVMVGVVSSVMTMLILILSEIMPKTIGATYWKSLAGFTARVLKGLVWVMYWTGLLWLLQLFTKLVGKKSHGESVFSREEFKAMADIAHEEGIVQETESKVIKNMLKFDEVFAKDIMTPRAVMKIAHENTSVEEFFSENPKLRFSRIPIFGENEDNITGFVLKDNVLEEIINNNGKVPLLKIKRDLLITKRNTPIPQLFETLIAKREHIALVVDEYGSVSGLVTMEDVIETLLGLEIMDESDNVEDLQLLARKKWEARAKRSGIIE